MSTVQTACLAWLALNSRPNGERCFGFQPIAMAIGIERSLVRRAVRALARKGYAEFHKGLCNDDGEFAGAGYCVSPLGLMAAPPAA